MYFQGSSEPVDHGQLQTLHLMKPNYYVTFSEDTQSHHQDNTDLLFNPTTINTSMAHQQQFVGFTSSLVHHQRQDQEDHVHNNIPRLYNHSVLGLAYQHGNQTNMAQSVSPQALSLSLSPHKIITEALQKSNTNMNHTIGQDLHEKSTNFYSSDHTLAAATGFSYPVQGVILGSKYLKAAQELLDEMASVGKATKIIDEVKDKAKNVIIKHQSNDEAGAAVHELTTAQRQEMQMKKAKLNIMLDEVDQRCRQYHHQMQITISWFERETGIGSSRSYTQLALKTILKQFKRLKSAIISQIKSINKSLGEEHNSGETFQQGSRLKFIDHQLRQRRSSLQENAWRPQRGLPEAAVSVLRAWLFEHFLHPYPKDSDKIMMAKQTGLTRSQVSNWFINARVRLWKPMVEEMYLEETKNQEQASDHKDSSSSSYQDKNIKQSHHDHNQVVTTDALQPNKDQHHENPTSHLVRSPTADISPSSVTISASLLLPQLTSTPLKFPEKINNLKRPRNMIEKNQENSPSSILSSAEMEMKDHSTMIGNDKGLYGIHRHDYLSTLNMNSDHHHVSSGFGNYGIGELSRFNTQQIQANNSQGNDNNSNNGNFSLSLALPPSSGNYHMSSHRNSFEFGIGGIDNQIGASRVDNHGVMNNDDRSSHPSVGVNYEVLDFYNRSKRYASHQMLPDFVA